MSNNITNTEKAYTTKEVADYTDIAPSTVRKYAQLLESTSYNFIKSENGARVYVEKDVIAFKFLKELRESSNIKLDQAIAITVQKHATHDVALVDTQKENVVNNEHSKQYEELKEMIHKQDAAINKQNELLEVLTNKLDVQHNQINNSINRRDEHITKLMRLTMENKKLLNAPRKSFWDRIRGR